MRMPKPSVPAAFSMGFPQSRCFSPAVGVGVFVALSTLVIAGLPVMSQAAVPVNTASFSFSGSLKGTLHGSACSGSASVGGEFVFSGSLKGTKGDSWAVNVNIGPGKAGTYSAKPKASGIAQASIVLSGGTSSKTYNWLSTSGTITATLTTGSVKVTLGPDRNNVTGLIGKGTIHVKGSWNCPG